MAFFRWIDTPVLGVFQRFATWFQKWTGYTNFDLARAFAVLWVCSVIANMFVEAHTRGFMWTVAVDYIVITAMMFVLAYGFGIVERRMLENAWEGVGNPIAVDPRFIIGRALLFLMVIENVVLHLVTAEHGIASRSFPSRFIEFCRTGNFFCCLNFFSCTPLPPCAGRIREMFARSRLAVAAAKE